MQSQQRNSVAQKGKNGLAYPIKSTLNFLFCPSEQQKNSLHLWSQELWYARRTFLEDNIIHRLLKCTVLDKSDCDPRKVWYLCRQFRGGALDLLDPIVHLKLHFYYQNKF